ncbi:MAG: hypothetical protein LUI85_16825 [Bacteroides sp.]|nr:hypothetical protein [Bacteroides sp.]
MNRKLFRQQAADTFTSPERINEYIRVTGPSLPVFLIALLVCVASACVWLFQGTVTDTVKLSGVIFPHRGVIGVNIPIGGVVTDVFAKRGRYVYQGEKLLGFVQNGASGVVTAPVTGVVLSYKAENEGFNAFESCVYLLPQEESMQNRDLITYVSFKELRKLAIGMEVQVSPADLSREEYGYMIGHIVEIANYPTDKAEAASRFKVEQFASDIFPKETAYEVKVVLDSAPGHPEQIRWSHRHRERINIAVGTFCNLQIVTRKRPVYELIFKLADK